MSNFHRRAGTPGSTLHNHDPAWYDHGEAVNRVRRDPAQPGVRARVYADIRRTSPGSQTGLPRDGEEQAAKVNP
ncbi:DUF6207 family protein [Streptomyces sp. MNU77]|uniref:DUF6207 family protein n=1 Tax=Streptomyces sp. MNU77 TaxID=1573406 RepID=UPI003558D2B2